MVVDIVSFSNATPFSSSTHLFPQSFHPLIRPTMKTCSDSVRWLLFIFRGKRSYAEGLSLLLSIRDDWVELFRLFLSLFAEFRLFSGTLEVLDLLLHSNVFLGVLARLEFFLFSSSQVFYNFFLPTYLTEKGHTYLVGKLQFVFYPFNIDLLIAC